jgi:hypothetical protein
MAMKSRRVYESSALLDKLCREDLAEPLTLYRLK